MQNMIMYKDGEASWIRWIKKRIDNNLNFLSITIGETGSGKSYANLSMAHMIDPEFDPKEQVAFKFSEFMEIINKFNNQSKEEVVEGKTPLHKRKYKVVVFDEVQTAVNKREWQSKINKLFLYLVSTFRHQNIIVFFNSPYSDFIDSATMKLIHVRFECRGWNNKTKKSSIRGTILQYNDKMSKFYYHPLYVIRDKQVNKFDGLWKINIPPKHIYEPYEEMKAAFTFKLNQSITREIKKMEEDQFGKPEKDERKPLTDKQRRVMEVLAHNPYKKAQEILGIAKSSIHQCKALALKKGYSLEEFKKNDQETKELEVIQPKS